MHPRATKPSLLIADLRRPGVDPAQVFAQVRNALADGQPVKTYAPKLGAFTVVETMQHGSSDFVKLRPSGFDGSLTVDMGELMLRFNRVYRGALGRRRVARKSAAR